MHQISAGGGVAWCNGHANASICKALVQQPPPCICEYSMCSIQSRQTLSAITKQQIIPALVDTCALLLACNHISSQSLGAYAWTTIHKAFPVGQHHISKHSNCASTISTLRYYTNAMCRRTLQVSTRLLRMFLKH